MSLINYISRCAISEGALDKFKRLFNDRYQTELSTRDALWLLGFDTDKHGYEQRFGLIRSQAVKHKVFESHYYAGIVRGKIKIGDDLKPVKNEKGNFEYTSELHHLTPLYEAVEVVTADVMGTDVLDILDVGEAIHYNKVRD